MGWLEGDVALVTGGGSGIGRGVVEVFLEEGARVAVLEKDRKKVEDLKRLGERVVPVVGDVTSLEDNERAVERAVSRFGRLDTLVCCAGVFDGFVSLLEFPKERLGDSFEEIFGVNVKGYILATKAALPQLLRNRGSVIYTTSHAAYAAGVARRQPPRLQHAQRASAAADARRSKERGGLTRRHCRGGAAERNA